MAEDKEQTIFGMKVTVNPRVPPGEVWLVGPPRIVGGIEVRDHIKITNVEVPPSKQEPSNDG